MTKTTTKALARERVASLIIDGTLYPRSVINDNRIGRLAEALRAGAELPALVAEPGRRRIIDGVHRYHAHLRVYGTEAEALVEWRTYPDDSAAFIDAAAINAVHGEPLSSFDLAHCLEVAQRFNIPVDALPAVLALTAAKIEQMTAQRFATAPDGQLVLLKRSARHLAGAQLTRGQVAGNERASGMQLVFHINQVILALESGIAPLNNPAVLTALRRLAHLIPDDVAGAAAS